MDVDEHAQQCARRIDEILAATMDIRTIRERATEICIGLQDLELPAFVTSNHRRSGARARELDSHVGQVGVDHGLQAFSGSAPFESGMNKE
jgi:hypothetical protein